MARSVFHFVLLLFLILSCAFVQPAEEGFIRVNITDKGLDFIKDFLMEKAESILVPLELPEIEKSAKIPVVGKVQMVLSKIVIGRIDVISSTIESGDTGIVFTVSGATADLSMDWRYSYKTWLVPITISDEGSASVRVEDMDLDLTLGLRTVGGSLKLDVLDCDCQVRDISIKLDGGASWLYQGLVDAFENKISSSIENAISKKVKDGMVKVDSLLQSLPKEIPVMDIAALNVTLVDDPDLSDSSLELAIDGLFSRKDEIGVSNQCHRSLQPAVLFKTVDKMVGISLHEEVLQSLSSVFFYSKKMHWNVDKAADQFFLNTSWWKFIVPQLYKMYPNDDINLNLSVSSPPILEVENEQIMASIPINMVIDVLDVDEVIPVACISVVINASASAEISRNILSGTVTLSDFTMSLKWTKIGDLHVHLIQTSVSDIVKTIILPYINLKLSNGFQLPSFHGYELQDAEILCTDPWVVISSDLASVNPLHIA